MPRLSAVEHSLLIVLMDPMGQYCGQIPPNNEDLYNFAITTTGFSILYFLLQCGLATHSSEIETYLSSLASVLSSGTKNWKDALSKLSKGLLLPSFV
jgi:hypothetical protein